MTEEKFVADQTSEESDNGSSNIKEEWAVTRRNFLQKTVAVASGVALTSMLPGFATQAWAEVAAPAVCPPGQPLQGVMEIESDGKVLRAVLKILDEKKTYLAQGSAGCITNSGQMRYIGGYDANAPKIGRRVWPPDPKVPRPGLTLRARLADRVEITLLNHVNVANFPGTLDVAEQGQACDQNVTEGLGNTYPGDPSFENPPNCFHGSASTNLHFHGTHISPSGIADNVLLNIRPSPRGRDGKPTVNEVTVGPIFKKIFADCAHGHQPLLWKDWPLLWQVWQKRLLTQYDNSTPWQGNMPTPGHPALPLHERLWYQNTQEMAAHQLPQFYIGAFPNCFTIPEWKKNEPDSPVMGQPPGTHWYHGHKHR